MVKYKGGNKNEVYMYSVNSENETVEVFGTWHITDSKFVAWEKAWKKAGWKYAGTTRRPMSQKAIKELVLRAIEVEQGDK